MATDTTQVVSIDDLPDMLKTARAGLEHAIDDLLAVLPVREYREDGAPHAATVFARAAADKAEITARRLEALMLPMIDDAIGNAGLAYDAVDEARRTGCETAEMTLTLFNRSEMAAWIGAAARLPEDPGSDVLLFDTPDGTVVIALGDTVERTMTGFRKLPGAARTGA